MNNFTEASEKFKNKSYLSNRIALSMNITIDEKTGYRSSCGFHLTRSKWDPYPWVSYVEIESIADSCGLRTGDCLLEINSIDIVGFRVKDISLLIKNNDNSTINVKIWRNSDEFSNTESEKENGIAVSGPLPVLVKKLATALSGTIRALECPVCLETVTSPVTQCVHGHILCVSCRSKSPRCPVCRVRLGQGRCLVAEEVQRNIREAFEDGFMENSDRLNNWSLREKLFGKTIKKLKNNTQLNRNINMATKSPFARLLFGGHDKSASVDNLSSNMSEQGHIFNEKHLPTIYKKWDELFICDRTKSASTGELSHDNKHQNTTFINSPLLLGRSTSGRVYTTSTSGHLSVPLTPLWGGSTESVCNNFLCPLASSSHCRMPLSYDNYIEHLGKDHFVVQVHFYGLTATISTMPLSYENSIFIFHHQHNLFFLKFQDEMIWITGTRNTGEWILHGQDLNGIEIKFQKSIAKIDMEKPLPATSVLLSSVTKLIFVKIHIICSENEFFDL